MNNKNICIIAPSEDFINSNIYNLGIKPVMQDNENFDYSYLNVYSNSTSQILRCIDQAYFVIICFDKSSLDTFYIAGICHSRAIRTIILSETMQHIPIILKKYPIIYYKSDDGEINLKQLRLNLQNFIQEINTEFYQLKTPVEDFFPFGKKRPVFEDEYQALKNERDQLEKQKSFIERQLEEMLKIKDTKSFRISKNNQQISSVDVNSKISFRPIK